MAMTSYCPLCKEHVKITNKGKFYKHKDGNKCCKGSGFSPMQAGKILYDRVKRYDLWG